MFTYSRPFTRWEHGPSTKSLHCCCYFIPSLAHLLQFGFHVSPPGFFFYWKLFGSLALLLVLLDHFKFRTLRRHLLKEVCILFSFCCVILHFSDRYSNTDFKFELNILACMLILFIVGVVRIYSLALTISISLLVATLIVV